MFLEIQLPRPRWGGACKRGALPGEAPGAAHPACGTAPGPRARVLLGPSGGAEVMRPISPRNL